MSNYQNTTRAERVVLVTACNNPSVYERFTARSQGVAHDDFHRFDNVAQNLPVPVRYNQFIAAMPADLDAWIAFVHNDFQFLEDPAPWLGAVPRDHIYGVVGADMVHDASTAAGTAADATRYVMRGQVECSTDLLPSGLCGTPAEGMVPVRTVDCCCIILHTSLLRRTGLRFDESYAWHLYSEELSLRAERDAGVRTFVLPIRSGHYGMGALNEAFHAGLKRIKEQFPGRLVSTCYNPRLGGDTPGQRQLPKVAPLVIAPRPAPANGALVVTVVVVVHRMARQAMRTLHSLSAEYQRGIKIEQYEVLIYENPSDDMLSDEYLEALPENFRYTRMDEAAVSPVFALNRGLREARGRVIGAMIDGARIVTPGLLRRALFASRTHPRSVVTTMGWYLGCDTQGIGLTHGYSPRYENELLQSVGWPRTPYRLFEVSTLDQSSVDGWVAPITESNAIFMMRDMWTLVGGYDEQFVSEGGGLANLDLLKRACETPNAQHVLIADEATFHQAHGGVATNATPDDLNRKLKQWGDEYRAIRGGIYVAADQKARVLYGALRAEVAAHLTGALVSPIRPQLRHDGETHQFLPVQDSRPVRRIPLRPPANDGAQRGPADAAVQLVQQFFNQHLFVEARDAARVILGKVGHGRQPLLEQILVLCANQPDNLKNAAPKRKSAYTGAMGRVHLALNEDAEAENLFAEAVRLDSGNDAARFALSSIRLPGPIYLDRLSEVHEFLRPRIYLEIGVFRGDSICLAKPPAQAFGVDPEPSLQKNCRVETRIHPWTSDNFFVQNARRKLIPRRVDFSFIDGLHDFMQVVKDFWNVERLCDPNSVIAFHDTLPLDRESSTKARNTGFWTGDVWKIIPFLLSERPELNVVTVKAPPSGLTLVSGLRPAHPVTLEQTLERAAKYDALEYEEFDTAWRPRMTMIQNSRPSLAEWLLFGKGRA